MSFMSIEMLPLEIQNQIAAGEVVERPAHLVKELVENSLDAGASEVSIDFSEGGRRVFVSDNGKGMSLKDLPKSLQRFATSKIFNAEDLWKLTTFGFRGEALASIASVAKMRMKSRTRDSQASYEINNSFGAIDKPVEVSGEVGTSIWVSELFENVPARLKFLKSESAEHTQIKNTLKALALSHSNVTFRVLENGQLTFLWPATNSPKERVQQILEIKNLFEGKAERGGVQARVVFASPDQVAKTSKNIWLFAQNRWVQDRTMQAAVMEAYRNLLMHGEFPQAVVWVETIPDQVDVNIHPTKSQVKFLDPSLVFRAVQAALREELEKAPWIKSTPKNDTIDSSSQTHTGTGLELENIPQQQISMRDSSLERTQSRQKEWTWPPQNNFEKLKINFSQAPDVITSDGKRARPEPPTQQYWSLFEVLGQAHHTYILAQDQEKLILVDQHAAHERVAFEKLMKAWKTGQIETQEFLFPLAVDMSSEKIELIEKNALILQNLGIHFEKMGPQTLGIRSCPSLIKESVLAQEIVRLGQELIDQGGSGAIDQVVTDLCARMACHSVVRAGQALSHPEMKSLLESMDEFPLSSYCPHGRPVCVEFPYQQLEKDFGRRL